MVSAPARRALVREWIGCGASERRALAAIGMSASALRYRPCEDRNVELRERILALAHRHRRYGVGMIYLKLRQEGRVVNYKRVERLYREQQLQVRRRRRKKVPVGERQPLLRPSQANQVWSMDFVFDRTVEGRVIKCLVIVDDATHEAVAIDVERAISGHGVARVLDRLAHSRGLPQMIRTEREACPRGTTARSFAAGRWSPGRTPVVCSYGSSSRANRTRTPTSNRSTADYATNASTSTGSQHCCTRAPRSNAGDANTTRTDPKKQSAA